MTYPTPPRMFEELIEPFDDAAALALRLRAAILRSVPGATETVSGGLKFANALYSVEGPNDVVCGLQPTAAGVKLFVHGVQADPSGRLRVEGSGKNVRHVKFAPDDDVDEEAVVDLLQLALERTR